MKKVFYILALFTAVANAQIVTIPDANFKAKLLQADTINSIARNTGGIAIKIDTDNDGEIQVSEALTVAQLQLTNSNISDLTGISAFSNLLILNCDTNNLNSLDVSANTNLQSLSVFANGLTSLDVSNLTALQGLTCSNNFLTSLDVSNLPVLYSLSCNANQLASLNVIGDASLQTIYCSNNQLTSLDAGNLTALTTLSCYDNPNLASLNLVGNLNLRNLTCQNGQLTNLDLRNLNSLISVNCSNNLLTEILLGNNNGMSDLNCSRNPLTAFNVNGSRIGILYIMDTLITNLDLSSDPILYHLYLSNNPVEYINLKNGQNVFISFAGSNPNLRFICTEESNIASLQTQLNSFGYVNTVCNSYCSFEPGGNHNTINGTVTFDANNNGCDSNDIFQPNIRVGITNGPNSGASFTSNNGNYIFYALTGSFTITPNIENPAWFNFTPASAVIPFGNTNNNNVTQDFCLSANGIHPDVEVVVAPAGNARPGFNAYYKVVFKNKGNQTLSGNVTFNYDDSVLDFVSSDVPPTSQSFGTLNYNYTNLLPFENRSFYIALHVNAPTDSPAVNIGDHLVFSGTVDPVDGDENPSDNAFQFQQTVSGAFDPNDITCIEGDIVSPAQIGNYLHYIINFENTGTADAENIVVRDVIDVNQFDLNSLQLMNSSAPVTARLTGNVAEFIFQNINLHSGGHGNILLKMKTKNTLVEGNTVSKKASIYFDYNFPVDTALENTTFRSLSNSDVEDDASISIYPNPSKGTVNINCSNMIKSVQLYDVQGRLLQTSLINENQAVIDISNQSVGVYFLKIISDKGMGVKKIVRE
ncbi:T9SS type A sorting domain-containing protein [Flavobacterium wongokense]|uniref:T9SS type A sorting domain-containing protein n=1 Tax=Flavobacterium wongokense TaxID=2910674 RepID=UPI001F2E5BAE|nr:T9SS type A sorting domain-containing protein [Flavobacterium sp. WG47]MCF6132830.1 T9SS type A sorting domain-containing protein [Flavobacterium sp. WG47]